MLANEVDGSAVEALLVYCGLGKDKAKVAAGAIQLAVFALLIVGICVFLEWRLVAFEAQGCSAYCNCTTRIDGHSYTILPNGSYVSNDGYTGEEDQLIERLEVCESDLVSCETAYDWCC